MAALNPARFQKVFGIGFVKDYAEHIMLEIGADGWTRADLARLGIVQTRACSILNSIAKRLKVKDLQELYDTTSPYTLAEYPCGVVTLYVLFAVFLDRDLEPNEWYRAGQERAITTFVSLKKRELDARTREVKESKARERKVTRQRHETAVKRVLSA